MNLIWLVLLFVGIIMIVSKNKAKDQVVVFKPQHDEVVAKEQLAKAKSDWDNFVYMMLCISSFGLAYIIRLIITTAIKKAR